MGKKLKIAFLGVKGIPSKSGTERVVEAIIHRLADEHDITVYCDPDYTPRGTEVNGVKLIWVPTLKGKHMKATSLDILGALHAIFKGNYDVVHVNGVETCFVLPLLRLKYRVISTAHGSPRRHPREKWGKAARILMGLTEYPFLYLSNYATSVSKVDSEYFERRYGKKAIFIPNGIDERTGCDIPAARSLLAELNYQPDQYIMFSAGRIDPSKGCHLVIDAYKQVKPDLPLMVVGDLEQVPAYGESLKQAATGDPITFVPLIKNKELLLGLVKLCKYFVFPSLFEGMSVMLLEAASLGVPIICSDIPENQIVMKDSVLYFRCGDTDDLQEKMKWALAHPKEMQELGSKASAMLKEHLTWGKIAQVYDSLYEACVDGKDHKINFSSIQPIL